MRASFIASLVGLVLAHGAAQFQVKAADLSRLSLVGTHITDNGDGDGIADSNETVQIGISVQSHGGTLRDCVAWLSTESPAVDCMRKSEILIGDVSGSGPAVTPVERFEITFGNVDRHDLGLGPDDPLEALLTLDIRCSYGSSTLRIREPLRLSLDRNVLDQGQTPVTWEGDFEAGGINPAAPLEGTAFYAQNIDSGLPGNHNAEGLINSDDWRCQYSDPDWRNSSPYNNEGGMDCYPGMDLAQADAVFWQVDGSLEPDSPDGGRAHRGEKSVY